LLPCNLTPEPHSASRKSLLHELAINLKAAKAIKVLIDHLVGCGKPKRTFATRFTSDAQLIGANRLQSFRPIATSRKIRAIKRCVFERVACSVATSFPFSSARAGKGQRPS
jgi:hypothetical protein